MCRAAPTLSATTRAQKPVGSLRPPLSGSHIGLACPWTRTRPATPRAMVTPATIDGLLKNVITNLLSLSRGANVSAQLQRSDSHVNQRQGDRRRGNRSHLDLPDRRGRRTVMLPNLQEQKPAEPREWCSILLAQDLQAVEVSFLDSSYHAAR